MSYITLEVEIDHGKLTASDPDKLPEKARGLLTILPNEPNVAVTGNEGKIAAFKELSQSLNLDDKKAKAWMDLVRDARR
jgi:hypothetical protein